MATPRHGRPEKNPSARRDRRVVTFVTEAEHEQLVRLALRDDRSLSFVIHRMIAMHLAGTRTPARGDGR